MTTEVELKQAHAQQICSELAALKLKVDGSDPNPWFGGLPPLYVQLTHTLSFHSGALKEKFGI